jgi:heme a synthase
VRMVMGNVLFFEGCAREAADYKGRAVSIKRSPFAMEGILPQQVSNSRAVRVWLIAVAALIALMVLVGGATRLTESGLSIVEWKPVTGTLPPLTSAQWQDAFEGYKKIPQYRELNAGMSLADFKTIFWWEWSHRLLGRFIGAAFLLPFLYFLWRGVLAAELKRGWWLRGCRSGWKCRSIALPFIWCWR